MLKNLLVKQAEVEEQAIEEVIQGYVQYSDSGKILKTKNFEASAARKKIVTYLIAKLGWKFIPGKENFTGGASNAELERELKLSGGTIRPEIKYLRDNGLITTIKGMHNPTDQLIFQLVGKKDKVPASA